MLNYRCDFSYNGANFHGCAEQVGKSLIEVPTVIGKIREVIELVTRENWITINVAGRTDKGVHARAQVINFKLEKEIDTRNLLNVINGRLSPNIVAHKLELVDEDFHARFSAKARSYKYFIYNAKNQHPFYAPFTWHVHNELNIEDMIRAAKYFVGEQDFTSFCKSSDDVQHNIREVFKAELNVTNSDLFQMNEYDENSQLICFEISANAFCWQMVRSITGTLVDVGRGKVSPDSIPAMFEAKDRAVTKQLAPSSGLCLFEVLY